jgi:hypothetical protein
MFLFAFFFGLLCLFVAFCLLTFELLLMYSVVGLIISTSILFWDKTEYKNCYNYSQCIGVFVCWVGAWPIYLTMQVADFLTEYRDLTFLKK